MSGQPVAPTGVVWTGRAVAGVAVLLLVLGVVIGWRIARNRATVGDDLTVQSIPLAPAGEKIDPPTASWASLARLPEIGPKLAKAIVAQREQILARDGQSVAFHTLADLRQVPGIGPATVEAVAPYVAFPAPATRPAA
jgi:hypothetical protein